MFRRIAILNFLRTWILPVAMIIGAVAYVVYVNIPWLKPTHSFANSAVAIVQPILIFTMLFLSFCRVSVKDLRPCRWHLWLVLIQVLSFSALALVSMLLPKHADYRILVESAMLCLICPTATSAAVVVGKLDGRPANVITYTIIINLMVAWVVPMFIPLVHPQVGVSFVSAFLMIMGKVFPLLICPLLLAFLVRYLLPSIHKRILKYPDLPFYLWAIALSLAITMTTKSIAHTHLSVIYQVYIALISLAACALQFYVGKKIGRCYGDSITAGQALGQKNTVLIIWMGYTFFTPITAIAGGFYSVWHNVINSYQLYSHKKQQEEGIG